MWRLTGWQCLLGFDSLSSDHVLRKIRDRMVWFILIVCLLIVGLPGLLLARGWLTV